MPQASSTEKAVDLKLLFADRTSIYKIRDLEKQLEAMAKRLENVKARNFLYKSFAYAKSAVENNKAPLLESALHGLLCASRQDPDDPFSKSVEDTVSAMQTTLARAAQQ